MKLKLLLLLAFGLFLPGIHAATVDTNAVLTGWLNAQVKLENWKADFTQTRKLKTLTQPLVAKGRIWFAAPNRFRWELLEPAPTTALRVEDGMVVIYPQLKRAERYPLNASTPSEWREALSLLEAGFPRDRKELEARFQIGGLTQTNTTWQIKLVPTSQFVRRMMTEIRIGLSTNDFALLSNELVFADGSQMRNDFTNGVMNTQFEAGIFEWQPPAGYKVTEPFGK